MKRIQLVILCFLTLMLGSCFEIIEDVSLNDNGSGHVKVILNASQSRSDINALLLLKEVNGYPVPSLVQIKAKLNEFNDSVSAMEGFTNVTTEFDDENYIIIFGADFDKVERLNDGIYAVWNKFDPTNSKRELYFKYTGETFVRQPGQLFNALYLKMKSGDKKVLDNATFTAIYRFSKLITAQKNTAAKVSPNKKVVFLKLPLQLMIQKPSYWYNTVALN